MGPISPGSTVINWRPARLRSCPDRASCCAGACRRVRGHDDLSISTALTSRLDALDWRYRVARGS